jgi:hypothetical protein
LPDLLRQSIYSRLAIVGGGTFDADTVCGDVAQDGVVTASGKLIG